MKSNTIFITGASQGLGKSTAKLFAKKGWTVIATMRNPDNASELSQLPNVHLLELDITKPDQIKTAAAEAEQIRPVDVLFNNAGYGFAGALEGASVEQLDRLINTNFLGTILVTQAFLPHFRARKKGTVITTTSSTAYIPYPYVSVYQATKSALETWAEGLSFELNRFMVNIKTVVPGYMQTNFGHNGEFAPHQAYADDFNKYVSRLMADTASLADHPDDIARVVYEAANDGKKQIHYIAGTHATSEYEWLQKEGIDAVMDSMQKRFFDSEY